MSDSKEPNTKKTSSNATSSKLERLKERRKNRGKTSAVPDYESVNSELLVRLIATVTQHGTVTFGYTRDGGAYYINYWVDGDSIKEYVRATEDMDAFLRAEIEAWSI